MSAHPHHPKHSKRPPPIVTARVERHQPPPPEAIVPPLPLPALWQGPWPLNEDEIDLPDPPPPAPLRADGRPQQLFIGHVRAERWGNEPDAPIDIDVTVEVKNGQIEEDRIWIGMAGLRPFEALRLCNFLIRALRRDGK